MGGARSSDDPRAQRRPHRGRPLTAPRDELRRRRLGWALIGSVWAHLLCLLPVRCVSDVERDPPRALDVLMITTVPEPDAAGDRAAEAEAPTDALRDVEAALVRSRVATRAAAAALAAVTADGADVATELDAARAAVELLDAALAVAADARAAALTADVDPAVTAALDARAAALSDAARGLGATTFGDTDAAVATAPIHELARLLSRPDSQTVAEAPAEEAATADAPEASPEPAPAPEVPLEPEPATHWRKFVQSDQRSVERAPEHSDYESSRDADDETVSRREVTARDAGQDAPFEAGRQSQSALPRPEVRQGETETSDGRPNAEQAEQSAPATAGGGAPGDHTGRGTLGEAGDDQDGGAAAASRDGDDAPRQGTPGAASAGAAATAAVVGAAGAPGTSGAAGRAPDAVADASDVADGAPSGWWQPTAVRITPAARSGAAAATSTAGGADTLATDGVAVVERPGRQRHRGGKGDVEETPAGPVESEAPIPDVGRESEEPTDEVDPIADLRAALGWGEIDREALRPRASASGQLATTGQAPTSQQRVVSEDADIAAVSYIQARGTAEGAYTERIYRILLDAWHELDLTDDEKALGVQGDVVVQFRVHHNGRVSDLTIIRSSGHALLDSMATLAVPTRLPRLPREIDQPSLLEQVTFRYRNPIVDDPLTPR